MTFFLGVVLLVVIYDVVGVALLGTDSRSWWRVALGVVLALVIARLMMLSYWDWRPSFAQACAGDGEAR